MQIRFVIKALPDMAPVEVSQGLISSGQRDGPAQQSVHKPSAKSYGWLVPLENIVHPSHPVVT